MPSLRPGEKIGRYRVLEEISRGGTAIVYRAIDEGTGTPVALKVLQSGLDLEQRARLEREARVLRALSHPNLAVLHDTGEVHGCPFIVFELLIGGTLADEVARRGRLPWGEAARHGARVASALGTLHEAGLVHRDVKPANVLLDETGQPRLTDLGLVRVSASLLASAHSLTEAGTVLGTLEYIAPEQANASADLDGRADLYSLGATLHALIAGAPPFQGEGYALVRSQLIAPPPPLSKLVAGVPPSLEALVLRLLEKDPADRPANAREVMAELDAIADGRAGASQRPVPAKLLAVALALTIAVGAGVVVTVQALRESKRRAAEMVAELARAEEARRAAAAASQRLANADAEVAGALASLGGSDLRPAFARLDALLATSGSVRAIELEVWLARARLLLCLERTDEAAAAVAKALAIDPDSAMAHALKAELLLASGTWQTAGPEVDRALALDPRCERARALEAGVVALRGDPETGRRLALRQTELHSDEAIAWEMLGFVHQRAHDVAGALASYTNALALEPANVRALGARALYRSEQGDAAGARADLERITELSPRLLRPWLNLARQRIDEADGAGALEYLARAEAVSPQDLEIRPMRVQALGRLGRFTAALDEADRRIAQRDDVSGRLTRAQVRLTLAAYGGAIDDAARATKLEPQAARGWAILGEARRRAHDPLAREALERALDLDPKNLRARLNLGYVTLAERHRPEAQVLAEAVVRESPRDPAALALRSAVRLAGGDARGAEEDARLAIQLSNKRVEGWCALALVMDEEGKYPEAAEAATNALDRGEDAPARVVRATARIILGDAKGALEDAGRALAWMPADLRVLTVRAEARRATGDAAGARTDQERILALPESDERAYAHACEVAQAVQDVPFLRQLADRAVQQCPGSRDLRFERGVAAFELGDFAAAVSDLDFVLAGRVTTEALRVRGRALAELGRLEAALVDSQRALELDPESEEVTANHLGVLILNGKFDEGVALLLRWESQHAGQQSARTAFALVELRARHGMLAAALDTSNKLVAALPTTSEAPAQRAEVKRRLGDLEGALADAEAALALSPASAVAHTTRGLVREAKGDLAGARQDLEPHARNVSRFDLAHDPGLAALERLTKSR